MKQPPKTSLKKSNFRKFATGQLALTGSILVAAALYTAPWANASTNSQLPERVEVTFVLDTTGSMATLIDGAKRKIWSIANTIVDINPNADIRMALVGYRDFGDEYVVKINPMTDDLQDLYAKLNQFRAAGGGDTPEAVNEALDASLNKVQWSSSQSTKKFIFLVGDAPPHMDYNGPQYPELVKQASNRGIIINAVQAGRSRATRQIWQQIAVQGDGDYIPIPQSGGQVVVIETPYDREIIILQGQLDKTIIPYGNSKRRSGVADKLRSKEAASPVAQLESSKFYSKRAGRNEVITGGGDLVADLENGRATLEEVKPEFLPKALRDKPTAERDAYVKAKIANRVQLKLKMAELVKKRDAHVAKVQAAKPATEGDSFDRAVTRSLRKAILKE